MPMELLTFDDQRIANFAAHEEHNNFAFIDIIQGTQVSRTQFEISKKIGAQAFDRFRRRRGLVLQPGHDSRFQDSLITERQRSQLSFSILGDRKLEWHGSPLRVYQQRPTLSEAPWSPSLSSVSLLSLFDHLCRPQ
jgi:hypothetical protein